MPSLRKAPAKPADAWQIVLAIEEAQVCSLDVICDTVTAQAAPSKTAADTWSVPLADIPTIADLEAAIRDMRNGKAVSGVMTPELLKCDIQTAAQLLYPALLSFLLQAQQPFTHKGGSLRPLWKRKASKEVASSYRAILVSPLLPRIFHRLVRQRLMAHVEKRLQPLQIGGVSRMTVSFGIHTVNLLRAKSQAAKRSHGVIFCDLYAAFYRAQRSTIASDKLGLGLDSQDDDLSLRQLACPTALDHLGAPSHLQGWVQQIMASSWATVESTQANNSAF
eukprot:Skav206297  [mRNA]  locus=scaffold3268:96483:97754:+ [translate_table: standard]